MGENKDEQWHQSVVEVDRSFSPSLCGLYSDHAGKRRGGPETSNPKTLAALSAIAGFRVYNGTPALLGSTVAQSPESLCAPVRSSNVWFSAAIRSSVGR